jgi:thiol:disulfide interchange protein
LTAFGCFWLLWRLGGLKALEIGLASAALVSLSLYGAGLLQRQSKQTGYLATLAAVVVAGIAIAFMPRPPAAVTQAASGRDSWSEVRVQDELALGHPVFVYFTADWCLTCKANEATAINRDEVRKALEKAGAVVLVGDWTKGDPAITRFLEGRGRAGVPLYLWYEPGKEPEELPQILTPSMLTSRAQQPR